MDDLRQIIGAAIGAGLVTWWTGRSVRRDFDQLRAWCVGLAHSLGHHPPPEPTPVKDARP